MEKGIMIVEKGEGGGWDEGFVCGVGSRLCL